MIEINSFIMLLKMNFGLIWSKAWPIIIAILFFGFIIFIHELGHFTFAKLFKVKVNEFALGMGPTIFKKQGKETKYALRLFPIGGFVSMEGEDEDSDDERAFNNKPCRQRIIIVAAGAFMNILLGAVIVFVLLSGNDLIATNRVAAFRDDAVTSSYGLKEGDVIKKINNHSINDYMDLSFQLMRDKDGKMDITVKREGETVKLNDVQFEMRKLEDGTESMYFDFYVVGVKSTFLNKVKYSLCQTGSIVKMVYFSLVDMVTGQYGFNDLAGPIGTVSYVADAAADASATKDYSSVYLMMALITINVGAFNILPLPALDGGRLFFMLIELIRRKPVNRKYESLIHAAGLVLLLIFMAVVSTGDIIKLVKGG